MPSPKQVPDRPRLPRVFRSVTNPDTLHSFFERVTLRYGNRIEPINPGRICLELLMLKELLPAPTPSNESLTGLNQRLATMPLLFSDSLDTSAASLVTMRAVSVKNRAVLAASFTPNTALLEERHFVCEAVRQSIGYCLDDPSIDRVPSAETPEYEWLIPIARTVPNSRQTIHRSDIQSGLKDHLNVTLALGPIIID